MTVTARLVCPPSYCSGCSRSDTVHSIRSHFGAIHSWEPNQRTTHNKRVQFLLRTQDPQRVRLFDTVRLFGFCWYLLFRLHALQASYTVTLIVAEKCHRIRRYVNQRCVNCKASKTTKSWTSFAADVESGTSLCVGSILAFQILLQTAKSSHNAGSFLTVLRDHSQLMSKQTFFSYEGFQKVRTLIARIQKLAQIVCGH